MCAMIFTRNALNAFSNYEEIVSNVSFFYVYYNEIPNVYIWNKDPPEKHTPGGTSDQ